MSNNTPQKQKNPSWHQGFSENTNVENNTPNLSQTAAPVKIDEAANTSDAQRKRLLEVLRNRSLTTLEARRELDVLHPAARVMELRKQGYDIQTIRVPDLTSEGRAHNVARYILRGDCR
ncbi:MAG: helix-turn-helix domain-containing protein [Desulfovibrio sp.]|nr:helix-turn-helix domain-containing protein [Desulfovibrio sp.]MBI4959235.1 helix-turn-helix domain-containing protein [Desulfovibrio sp.]